MPDAFEFRLDQSGEFDEFVAKNAAIHVERMNETGFWIGIDLPGGARVKINTGVESGKWFFNIEEDGNPERSFGIERKA